MLESKFQSGLIEDLKTIFPGCIVLKNDANYLQGFPDLTILYGNKWATLECKRNEYAERQPNQEYYVGKLDGMSFAAFIYPENKEDVLYELQLALRPHRKARISRG